MELIVSTAIAVLLWSGFIYEMASPLIHRGEW